MRLKGVRDGKAAVEFGPAELGFLKSAANETLNGFGHWKFEKRTPSALKKLETILNDLDDILKELP